MRGLRSLFGYTRLRIEASRAADMMNFCRRYRFVYWDVRFEGDTTTLCVSLLTAMRMRKRREALVWETEGTYGLPRLLSRYRRRYGVLLGMLLLVAVIFLSGRVIWDIRIDGNERLEDAEVIEQLNTCGLHIGSVRERLDIDTLENRVLILSEDISWISVNIIGTVAQVEIRESEVWAEDETEDFVASNLVAARDGQIELFVDVRGNVVRRIGDVVRKGELLVSGIYDSATVGMRYTRAQGQVIARTEHTLETQIPLRYEKKGYTGRVWTEKYLIFFEKEVKIFGNTGNLPMEYDTIEGVSYGETPWGDTLPVGIRTVQYWEYGYETCERTVEEALSLAEYRLRCEASPILSQGELLREWTREERTEEHVTLHRTVEILENIALVKEIEIDLPSGAGWSKDGTENRQN